MRWAGNTDFQEGQNNVYVLQNVQSISEAQQVSYTMGEVRFSGTEGEGWKLLSCQGEKVAIFLCLVRNLRVSEPSDLRLVR